MYQMLKICHNEERYHAGYVTLISVLVVGAVGVSVAVSLLLLGLGLSQTSLAEEQSKSARLLADACAEEALEQIRESTSFTGSATLSLGNGSCSYSVSSGTGQNRTVIVLGAVGTVIRKATLTVDNITPLIHVSSWQEN